MDINELYKYVQNNIPHGRVYLRPAEVQLLAGYVSGAIGDHVEIGTLWGGSAIIAALAKRDADRSEMVITIDSMDTKFWLEGDPMGLGIPTLDKVIDNFNFFNVMNEIVLMAAKSFPWPLPLSNRFGTAFIDGDHHTDSVRQDFYSAGAIAPILLFHDYDPQHKIHKTGVVETLDQLVAQHQDEWERVEHTETILVVRRR